MINLTGLFLLYVAVSEQRHVWSTRCDHRWTWHQTILSPCLLNIITVVLQPQH